MGESTPFVAMGAFVLTLTLLYLTGAFIQWQLNPGDWSHEARGPAGTMGLLLGLIAGHIAAAVNEGY